jgi:hypothetical protein
MTVYQFLKQLLDRTHRVLRTRGRALLVAAPLVAAPVYLVACALTPKQAQTAEAIAGPACNLLGAGAGVAPVSYVSAIGGIVAVICQDVEQEIIADETVTPDAGSPAAPAQAATSSADAGSPAPVGVQLRSKLVLMAQPGCKAVPIPGDPRHQTACPELHATILAGGDRIDARKAKARR